MKYVRLSYRPKPIFEGRCCMNRKEASDPDFFVQVGTVASETGYF